MLLNRDWIACNPCPLKFPPPYGLMAVLAFAPLTQPGITMVLSMAIRAVYLILFIISTPFMMNVRQICWIATTFT